MAAAPKNRSERDSKPDPRLIALGDRVRTKRHELQLTLRELSERSGVSERFLVSLEGGHANVSVARLYDIADALKADVLSLLGGDERRAGGQRAQVVSLLGLRGAGKTTIGSLAAARLGVPFVELDSLVTTRTGLTLAALFELQGTEGYRRLEREELSTFLVEQDSAVLATGGGIVTDHQSFELLRRRSITIWLRASPDDHWNRVLGQGDARPMADRESAMEELRALWNARRALYERASYVVDTSALGLLRSVERVVKIARKTAAFTRNM
ncbi:MAG: helix-turn-helix domain-containing protein [Polyangiaceae bacterium]|nr:helix-turn-helix domain-containing protein [Polyangiaceae bacterium]